MSRIRRFWLAGERGCRWPRCPRCPVRAGRIDPALRYWLNIRQFSLGGSSMSAEPSFAELMERLRQGDQDAAADIHRRYGDEVRRMARIRLRTARMRRLLESSDVLQMVMFSFFKRADRGEFQSRLQGPDELLKLLATMVRFKVIDQARRAHAERRGGGNDVIEIFESLFAPAGEPSPSEQAVRKELIALARDVISDDEWELWQLRHGDKLEWEQIAQRLGGTADGQRKKHERIRQRLREQFGEEAEHGRA